MHIEVANAQYEATPDNTILVIGTTLLNSIYTDIGDDYVVIPAVPTRGYIQLAVALHNEGVPTVRLDRDEYDPTAEPYVHIINGLCRAFRKELDGLTVES